MRWCSSNSSSKLDSVCDLATVAVKQPDCECGTVAGSARKYVYEKNKRSGLQLPCEQDYWHLSDVSCPASSHVSPRLLPAFSPSSAAPLLGPAVPSAATNVAWIWYRMGHGSNRYF